MGVLRKVTTPTAFLLAMSSPCFESLSSGCQRFVRWIACLNTFPLYVSLSVMVVEHCCGAHCSEVLTDCLLAGLLTVQERKARVIDLIVDRSIFLQGTSTLPTEPWRWVLLRLCMDVDTMAVIQLCTSSCCLALWIDRAFGVRFARCASFCSIALQCMLVSCSQNPPLGTAYHVTRWHMKIEDTIARIAAKSSRKGFNFDPDDDVRLSVYSPSLPCAVQFSELDACEHVSVCSR